MPGAGSASTSASTADAYVPLSFAPGEAYQFDWSHEVVLINGTTVIVKVAHVRLCHSRMLFVRAYPRETQEMVFDAHDRAFAFFKGACTRGIYDNMKTAVETIFVGKERAYNRRFLQMCGHYLVDPVACTPASGWEKGQVENQVGLVRERFFTPRLRVKSYEELNAWLLDQAIAYAKAHPPSRVPRPDGLASLRGRAGQPGALCRPLRWLPCLAGLRLQDLPGALRQQQVLGRGERGRAPGRDPRLCRSHRASPGWPARWRACPLLRTRSDDLRSLALRAGARPQAGCPAQWRTVQGLGPAGRARAGPAQARQRSDGDRQMVDILATVLSDGLPAVEAACAEALRENVHSADVILNILARHRDCPPVTIMTPDALRLRHEPAADCSRYDSLRRAV